MSIIDPVFQHLQQLYPNLVNVTRYDVDAFTSVYGFEFSDGSTLVKRISPFELSQYVDHFCKEALNDHRPIAHEARYRLRMSYRQEALVKYWDEKLHEREN